MSKKGTPLNKIYNVKMPSIYMPKTGAKLLLHKHAWRLGFNLHLSQGPIAMKQDMIGELVTTFAVWPKESQDPLLHLTLLTTECLARQKKSTLYQLLHTTLGNSYTVSSAQLPGIDTRTKFRINSYDGTIFSTGYEIPIQHRPCIRSCGAVYNHWYCLHINNSAMKCNCINLSYIEQSLCMIICMKCWTQDCINSGRLFSPVSLY